MADNITLPGTGTSVRTVDISGVEYEVIMLADGSGNIIGSTLVTNGRGANVVVLNDMGAKGIADEGADFSANPVYVGARSTTSLIAQTPLATGKMIGLRATADGRLITIPWCNPEDQLPTTPITLTTTGDVQMYPALVSPVRNALLGMSICNYSSTDTSVIVKDGTTEIGRFLAPTVPVSGSPMSFPLPIRGTAATAMMLALSTTVVSNSVVVTPFGFKTKI